MDPGDLMYSMVTAVNSRSTIAKIVDLKSFHHNKANSNDV